MVKICPKKTTGWEILTIIVGLFEFRKNCWVPNFLKYFRIKEPSYLVISKTFKNWRFSLKKMVKTSWFYR